MRTVTQTGLTVEEAIEKALQQLNVSREEVEIETLTEGRRGFLGIGARDAEVRVTVKAKSEPVQQQEEQLDQNIEEPNELLEEIEVEAVEAQEEEVEVEKNPSEEAINYLINVAKEMQIHDLSISPEVDGKYLRLQLESDKAALLIGKRGQTLNALQQLTQLVANQHSERFQVVRLNVGDYRERRKESLSRLADRMADKAIHTNRKVQLEPMPAYERKVIHHALSNRLDIETYSEGTDPHRYLVIEPIR